MIAVILVLLGAVFLLWFRQVFVYVNNKTNSYIGNSSKSVFAEPLVNILSLSQSSQSLQVNQQNEQHLKTSRTQSLNRFIFSTVLSTLLCLVIPALLLLEKTHIQQVTQLFSQNTHHQYKLIYQNLLPSYIQIGQVISNIIFLTLFIKSVKSQTSSQSSGKNLMEILLVLMILINPYFISIYVLKILAKMFFSNNFNKSKHSLLNKANLQSFAPLLIVLLIITSSLLINHPSLNLLKQYYTRLIFPSKFLPQANLIWIFYSHMFNRYLTAYQLIFFSLPISLCVPLCFLKINNQTKTLIQYFAITFTSYQCSYFNLYTFWFICLISLPQFVNYKNNLLLKINKTLGYVCFVGSMFFFLCYQRLTQVYLSSWMVNIGYPFLFGCVAWALIVIWLAELVKIELEEIAGVPYQQDDNEKGFMRKGIQKIMNLVKFKFWTKSQPIQPKEEHKLVEQSTEKINQ